MIGNALIKEIVAMQEFIEDVKLTLDLDEDEYSDGELIDIITDLVKHYDNGGCI